ncbi:MAG: TIGR03986 family CRISPR-associated RAMP protein [Syntrophobacteraceae bacterium]|nr:TIGR03986 family CRISPR-associated RAMP protein [Syntrophobacteraceae bacterium]
MALTRGKLVLSKKGKPQIEIDGKLFNPAQCELSQSILSRLKELNGAEVEFELEGGQPKKIRKVGSQFAPAQAAAAPSSYSRASDRGKVRDRRTADQPPTMNRDFRNPYNFIPAPPRKTDDPDLGDYKPVPQDRFHPDRFTGRIRVVMETITPLLVPDPNTCREDESGHKTFALLLGKDGKPLLPSSSIRGMLRSAYEAVTNSRFGRFPKNDHGKRLAYRMEAKGGLRLIPARIEDGRIRLLTGTSRIRNDGSPDGPQYAAWLPRYSGNNKNTTRAITYPDGSLPQHGDEVECWVERIRHSSDRFEYWKVTKIDRNGANIGNPPATSKRIRGWVCITNANINRKHDERVFFSEGTPPTGPFPITDELREQWRQLIENYQEIHEEDLKRRERQNQVPDEYLGPEPGRTAWSRHVYTEQDRELRDGTLCYARLKNGNSSVEALFPVMIARELYPISPWDLLHSSLRPASKISELSPADRVFGWVMGDPGNQQREQRNPTAVRGLLRIGPVTSESSAEDAIETFPGDGLPLAVLAAPKPQQGRFYVAASPQGEAQNGRLSKTEAGYTANKGLRGRKVYPHHSGLPADHWQNALEDRTQNPNGPWQEYRRPMKDNYEQRDDQNRSILGWVKSGTRFGFDIHVANLTKVELGALLFLLQLPEGHYHRFGGGKPLGFGSVRLSAAECKLMTGELLCERYRAWSDQCRCEDISEGAVAAFKEAVTHAYGRADGNGSFEQVSFIEAFLKACMGFDDRLPVHYPRVTRQPSPDGESFKWFVANEKDVARFALGDLAQDPGLPTLQDVQASGGTHQRRRN